MNECVEAVFLEERRALLGDDDDFLAAITGAPGAESGFAASDEPEAERGGAGAEGGFGGERAPAGFALLAAVLEEELFFFLPALALGGVGVGGGFT